MVYQSSLRLAERLKLGGPSLGRSPDAHKQRRLVNQDQIQVFGEIRVDTIFGAGLGALLFFFETIAFKRSQMTCASSNPIERSFELAAERCEDLTPLVYRRLFDAHPEARTMFRTEGSELVKGSMLALTIDAILDFAGERTGHFRLIECGGFLARRLRHAARIVRRVLRHHRADAARDRSARTGRTRSMRRGGSCSVTSKVSLQRSELTSTKLPEAH